MANKNFVVRHGLEVSGNTGVAGNLGTSGTLSVGGNTNLDGSLQVSGNTSIAGTLVVSGHTNLNRNLQVSGNTSIAGTLQVNGTTSVGGNLNVSAQLSVGGGAGITGPVTFGSDITHNGNADFNGYLQVSGNASVGGTLQTTGNTTLGGQLTVSGNTTLSGTLVTTGDTTLGGSADISADCQVAGVLSGAQLRSVSFDAQRGTTSVWHASTLLSGGQLRATSAKISGALTVCGSAQVSGSISCRGLHATGGNIQTTGVISGTNVRCVSFDGQRGTTSVWNVQTLLSGTQVRGTSATITGTLTVCGAATVSQRLTITGGTSTIAGVSFNAGWFRIGNATTGLAMDPNEIYFTGEGNLGTFSGNLNLNPAGQIAAAQKTMTLGTLDATTVQASGVLSGGQIRGTSARIAGTLTVCGAADISSNCQVAGVLSGAQLRCVSFNAQRGTTSIWTATTLRGTSARIAGTLTVCGAADISGACQVAGVLSGGQLRFVSYSGQRGTTSVLHGTTLLSGNQLRGTSAKISGALTVCGSTDISGNCQVAGVLSGGQLRCVSYGGQRGSTSEFTIGGNTYNSVTTAAKIYKGSVTSNNSSYVTAFTVDGGSGLSSMIEATFEGSISNVVVATKVRIIVNHSGDIRIVNESGNYVPLKIKVISDNNNDYAVQIQRNAGVSGDCALDISVLTLDDSVVTFTSSHSFSGATLEVDGEASKEICRATGGNDYFLTVGGAVSSSQLRCASLRITGNGTAAICGSMDVCGSVQVAAVLSGAQLRCVSFNAQRMTTSTIDLSNTLQVSGSISCNGLHAAGGAIQTTGVLSGSQLRCASFRTQGTLTVCGQTDISGNCQVAGTVSAGAYNFEMFGAVPAYGNSDYSTINWSTSESAIQLRSSSDTSIGMAFPAFRVNSLAAVAGRWRITIQVKASAAATSGLYIRVYEYNAEMPNGKVAISNSATNADVQEDSDQGTISPSVENTAIGTSWETKTFYYSPASDAVYASIVVLNWTGIGTNHLYVKPPILQPEYTGTVSSTQLRCASLRVTGNSTAAICGSVDISGRCDVADVLSGGQLRCVSFNGQRGTVSSWDVGGFVQVSGVICGGSSIRTAAKTDTNAGGVGGLAIYGTGWSGISITGGQATKTLGIHYGGSNDNTLRFGRYSLAASITQTGSYEANVVTFDMDNGNIDCQGSIQISGSTSMGGSLDVSGNVCINGYLTLSGVADFNQQLQVSGTIAAAGQVDIAGSLQVSGAISGGSIHLAAGSVQTTGIISGGQLRCTSFKSEEHLTVSSNGTTGNTATIAAAGSGTHYLIYQYATNGQYAGTMDVKTTVRTATTAFQFLGCYSNNAADAEYVLRGNGQAGADGSWQGGGVDYAEYFEWKDGNPNNEPRYGQPVYLISGEKIALATSGNIPIGVISKNPAVTGGSAWNKWEQKYLRDVWNDYILNEDGERILNPDFNPDLEYIPRGERSEWDAVGLMGKLAIQKDYITDTIRNNTNWLKMTDINDNVEKWLVK